jgi:hypothetical protein
MSIAEITCELVDERDLDTRYLADRLNPEEAEEFEAHFFGCERCWGLVQQGLAVRSVFDADLPARLPAVRPKPQRPTRPWWGLAAAAVAVVALGVWQMGVQRAPGLSEDVFRGGSAAFLVTATADSARLAAAWPRVPEADVYQVRLYGADGGLALEREITDTTVSVPLDSISIVRDSGLFWQVQSLDRLRNPITRSDLTRAVIPQR